VGLPDRRSNTGQILRRCGKYIRCGNYKRRHPGLPVGKVGKGGGVVTRQPGTLRLLMRFQKIFENTFWDQCG
jgi:glutaminase